VLRGAIADGHGPDFAGDHAGLQAALRILPDNPAFDLDPAGLHIARRTGFISSGHSAWE
jgi:hypothetical protein